MCLHPLHVWGFRVTLAIATLVFSGLASADPPARVARLGYLSGAVSFSPAGENDWDDAAVNRPLTTGDRLWTDAGARAEIQVGGAMIRMSATTGVSVLNLDDRITQLQLTQGTLNVRVRRLDADQLFEVDTPNLAFTLRQPGEYRIEVEPDGRATTIIVRKGQGEAYGDGAAYTIDSRRPYRFFGTDLSDYEDIDTPRPDDFDRWASDRDRRYDDSPSARYVSPDVVGYQDLDANGTWRVDATYGNVWMPNRVAAGWAPYRDGHWAWVDPWGWTWVDDAPWGFAVSHYGRWAHFGGAWGWVPGPVQTRAYYAPALVAFVGGANFQLTISSGNVGGIGWFPLAPREVYRPSYAVSRGYFENVNRSNTVINNTVINNTYNTVNVTNVVYANRQVPGAVIAVPTSTFVQSQPVGRSAVRAPQELMAGGPVVAAAPVAPTQRSVRGTPGKGDKPPERVFERPVVARTVPAAPQVGFAAQQKQLADKPGQPLDDAARKALRPAAGAPAPVVKVVPQAAAAPAVLPAPPAAAGPGNRRTGKPTSEERPAGAAPPVQGDRPAAAAPPASNDRPGDGAQTARGNRPGADTPAARTDRPAGPAVATPPVQVDRPAAAAPPAPNDRPADGAPAARGNRPGAGGPPARADRPVVNPPASRGDRPAADGPPARSDRPAAGAPPAQVAPAPGAAPSGDRPAVATPPAVQRAKPEPAAAAPRSDARPPVVARPPAPPAAQAAPPPPRDDESKGPRRGEDPRPVPRTGPPKAQPPEERKAPVPPEAKAAPRGESPQAQQRADESRRAPGKPGEKKKDGDAPLSEEEKRRQKE